MSMDRDPVGQVSTTIKPKLGHQTLQVYDIYFPPPFLRFFEGQACSLIDEGRIFVGRKMELEGLIVGPIIKPKVDQHFDDFRGALL